MKKLNYALLSFLLLTWISSFAFAGLAAGAQAPAFEGKDQDSKTVQLSDFKGKYLLLYFYPQDETPGCTAEACSMRDHFPDFKKNNIAVVGLSVQDAKSHKAFSDKYKLPFPLIVDDGGKIAKKFDVSKYPIVGLLKRQSILIGKDGKVIKFYDDVSPEGHAAEVLKDVEANERPKS